MRKENALAGTAIPTTTKKLQRMSQLGVAELAGDLTLNALHGTNPLQRRDRAAVRANQVVAVMLTIDQLKMT